MDEIKLTQEQADAIRKKYRHWADMPCEEYTQLFGEAVGFESGLLFVLRELGISIEGVNA